VLQVASVLAVFMLLVAWPVPEVNEPHYLGKARHYWHPEWVPHDFFFDAADGHPTFTIVVGWLSFLPRDVYAWTARLLVWGFQAYCWCRLWNTISRRTWLAPLAAGLFVLLAEQCEMAGEWAIGGAEAKGVAYALAFLGMAALARSQWNAVWCWLGLAASFHVLVGGWSTIAAGCAWIMFGRGRPRLVSMWKGLLVGGLCAVPGLYAALALTWQSEPNTVRAANAIYVYGRLAHHLDPTSFQWGEVSRFLALVVAWLGLATLAPQAWMPRGLRWFITGTLAISGVGVLLSTATLSDADRHAALMRFYWFRLSDVMVPLGVAIMTVNGLSQHVAIKSDSVASEPTGKGTRVALLGVFLFVSASMVERVWYITTIAAPRSFRGYRTDRSTNRAEQFADWQAACNWIAASTPQDARFLTPRMELTFKWYAGRSEVATWKDVPQDAASLVEWRSRLDNIYRDNSSDPPRWRKTLAELSPERLRELGDTYDASYLLVEAEPRLALDLVYQNNSYAVYRLDR